MSKIFKSIPKEKQDKIINAAICVFANIDYKQSLTDDIAAKAGIAKGSLFHYFKNKQSLYLYMYSYCIQELNKQINLIFSYHETDFFELVKQSMLVTIELYRKNPMLANFIKRANEESDVNLVEAISQINKENNNQYLSEIYVKADYHKFKPNTDINLLFKMFDWCSVGLRDDANYKTYSLPELYNEANKIINFVKQGTYLSQYL